MSGQTTGAARQKFGASEGVQFSGRYLTYAIGLLFVVNMFNYMDRMVLSVLLPLIKEDLQLSDTQLGLLTGFAFALFYAAFGIPIARWADRGVRRNIVALAIAVWSLMTALTGLAQNFAQMAFARVGVGVGEAGCIPPSHSLISDYFPIERRASALGIHTAGATVGIVIGLALGGWIGQTFGWRIAFISLGLPGLLLALVVRLTLKEPPRGHADGTTGESHTAPTLKEVFKYLAKRRSYIHLVLVFAVGSFTGFGISQWMPSFYVRSFGMSTAQVGLLFGIAYGLGAAIGTVGGGYLADRLTKRDMRWAAWIGMLAYIIAFPLALSVLLVPFAWLAISLNLLSSIVAGAANGPTFAMIQSVVSPRMRAMASAIVMFAASVIGIGAGPFFAGVLSDAFASIYGNESLRYSLMVFTVLSLWPAVHLYFASKHLKEDIAAAKTVS